MLSNYQEKILKIKQKIKSLLARQKNFINKNYLGQDKHDILFPNVKKNRGKNCEKNKLGIKM